MDAEGLRLPATLHSLLDSRAAQAPDRPFLSDEDRWWTYHELESHSRSIYHALARAGVRPGNVVAVMMPGSERYIATWFALSRLGAIEVPINGDYRGEILRHVLRTTQPQFALVDAGLREAFDDACSELPICPIIFDPMDTRFGWEPGRANVVVASASTHSAKAADPIAVIFTSGTTGKSKGVLTSHRHQISFGHYFKEIVGFTTEDVAYNFLPFFHVAARFQTIGAMLAGGRMVLRRRFSISNFWPDVLASGATLCVAVGGLCNMLYGQPQRADDARNTLRLIYAVPLPWSFREAFEQRFAVKLVEAYGSTESNLTVYTRMDEQTPSGSCGRANPDFEITIRDGHGDPLPAGQAGEICVRERQADTLMTEYLGEPEATAQTLHGGIFHSGDRGVVDENGFVFFLDRNKDVIRRRGENISSYEVERVLTTHPDIAEAAVVAVPAEIGEEEVKAIIVPRKGVLLEPLALLEYAVARMPYFMVPRYLEFRVELPRTETMKVRKSDLRSEGITRATWDSEAAGVRITRNGMQHVSPSNTGNQLTE